jgi:hypothetical protein
MFLLESEAEDDQPLKRRRLSHHHQVVNSGELHPIVGLIIIF